MNIFSAIICLLLGALVGLATKPKNCGAEGCKEPKAPIRLRDRGDLPLAAAGLMVFYLQDIDPLLIGVSASLGVLLGWVFTKKRWAAYVVALLVILYTLYQGS